MSSIKILIVDWVKGISYWCPNVCLFFNKMQILPFNSFMLRAILFALKLYYSLHSFCIFEHVFCFVCLHFHTLPLCFVFVFLHYVFCSVKTPRKAVLFHEYQASTGRFNKICFITCSISVSFMNAASWHVCLCVFVCLSP